MTWPFPFSPRTVLKYILLQVPSLLLVVLVLLLLERWIGLPAWAFWTLVAGWIAKDLLLFPLVWRAYETAPQDSTCGLSGCRGETRERLDPSGYVEVRGELWHAELPADSPPLEKDMPVRVEGHRGLTLLVVPDSGPESDREEHHGR